VSTRELVPEPVQVGAKGGRRGYEPIVLKSRQLFDDFQQGIKVAHCSVGGGSFVNRVLEVGKPGERGDEVYVQ
jgi:hypothetical protein